MTATDRARCSAKGCTVDATWAIHWRNPKIHDETRRKTWLACNDHKVTLSDFLGMRGFPLVVEPFESV